MRSFFRLSSILLPLVVGTSACSDATGAWFGAPPAVHLSSDSGDVIGSGKSYDYIEPPAFIQAEVSGGTTVPLTLSVTVQGAETWTGFFSIPGGMDRLQRGTYPDVDWHGGAHACSVIGSFTIDDVTYNGATLTAIDLHFAQHCTGSTAELRGTVHWRYDRPNEEARLGIDRHPLHRLQWRYRATPSRRVSAAVQHQRRGAPQLRYHHDGRTGVLGLECVLSTGRQHGS